MNWNFNVAEPPRKTGLRGPRVWVTLSDGRVMFGQPLFVRRSTVDFALHAWHIEEPDDMGAGQRALPEGVTVVAFAEIEAPQGATAGRVFSVWRGDPQGGDYENVAYQHLFEHEREQVDAGTLKQLHNSLPTWPPRSAA